MKELGLISSSGSLGIVSKTTDHTWGACVYIDIFVGYLFVLAFEFMLIFELLDIFIAMYVYVYK